MRMADNASSAFYARRCLPIGATPSNPVDMVKAPKKPPPLENFRAWRKKKKITQKRMAERLDIEQSMISRYETGQHPITLEIVHAYADALGIEPADFWRHPDAPVSELALIDRQLDPRARARWARIIKAAMREDEAA